MTDADWDQGYAKSLGVFLNGKTIPNPNPRGEPVQDDHFYLIFNAHHEPLTFTLPDVRWAKSWLLELATDSGWTLDEAAQRCRAGEQLEVAARSLVVLRHAT